MDSSTTLRWCPADPNLSDVRDMIRWARQMQMAFPSLEERYRKREIEYILELLAPENSQAERAALEGRLKVLNYGTRQDRKKRWQEYARAQIQNKIRQLMKAGEKEKGQALIARLKAGMV